MKTDFSKYKKFLFNLLAIWLCLAILKIFKIDFGLNLFTFFKILLLLTFILIIFEVKKRWAEIRPLIKSFFLEAKGKVDKSLGQYPTFLSRVVHFFPLIFRLAWRGFKRYALFKDILLAFCLFGILFDIFVFELSWDWFILFFTGLWAWSAKLHRFEGRVSIAGGLIFLIMCPFLLISQKEAIAEKAAVWAYMFLLVGVIQMIIEYIKEERKSVKAK